MAAIPTLETLALSGKRVLIRADLNVPVNDGVVGDRTRIERFAPTVRAVLERGGIAIILAHFDRPKGKVVPAMSLRQVVAALAETLERPVIFVATDWHDDNAEKAVAAARPGDVLLLENTRFHDGEEKNDQAFATKLAGLGDVFVADAFSCAHRAHASTEALARLLPSCAGLSMAAELEALAKALENPARPVMAIVGGAKISTKLDLLANLVKRVDVLVIGGAMANTFLAAQGFEVGKSLVEMNMYDTARATLQIASAAGCDVILPGDAVVAETFAAHASHKVQGVEAIDPAGMILDIGPASVDALTARLDTIRTVLWNGPFGAFELTPFDAGTNAVARSVAMLTKADRLVSVAGGGDTVAALAQAGVDQDFTYVSTAGGAFLEWLEGKSLPGVEVLKR
ncbi:MAG: phosphoglycerate kinase [Hyphomicrobiales bacterium]|nr:phosphoglycerate kinase [Hyphomicrobiales bacterium]OQW83027.1 MAG: phosphoglycerate kinase [Proteobacteria bacterium ST_bin15]